MSNYFPYDYTGPGPAAFMQPTSEYVTQEYMERIRGAENIRKWSRKGGTQSTTDTDAVTAARVSAAVQIEAELRGRYPLPLANASARDADFLRWAAERIASYELYIGRGLQEDDPTGNMLKEQRDEVIAEDGLLKKYGDKASGYSLDADQHGEELRNAPALV